ncbi:MAG: hypothetical protein AAB571_03955 [Chloroflexota bacterium]
MARPLLPSSRIFRVTFRLHPGKDDDLIALFDSIAKGERPETLGALLRSGAPATARKDQAGGDDETLMTEASVNLLD